MTARPVGFDLDGTLIDSSPQVLGSFRALARESGRPIDIASVEARLGLKLEDELAHWFTADEIDDAASVFRRHYLTIAAQTEALPGAREALEAVRASGSRAVIITAKHPSTVSLCCEAAGLVADEVVAFVHGPEKAAVLLRMDAGAYVGDTPPDMQAAVLASVVGVGVTTGSYDAGQLTAAGATVTMAGLDEFPTWYEGWSPRDF